MSKKENIIKIGDKSYEIKPLKMKHIRNNFYGTHLTLRQYGIVSICGYADGEVMLKDYLKATFDITDEEVGGFFEELDTQIIQEIMDKTKSLNKINEEELAKN